MLLTSFSNDSVGPFSLKQLFWPFCFCLTRACLSLLRIYLWVWMHKPKGLDPLQHDECTEVLNWCILACHWGSLSLISSAEMLNNDSLFWCDSAVFGNVMILLALFYPHDQNCLKLVWVSTNTFIFLASIFPFMYPWLFSHNVNNLSFLISVQWTAWQ